jgi:hypothetical protein
LLMSSRMSVQRLHFIRVIVVVVALLLSRHRVRLPRTPRGSLVARLQAEDHVRDQPVWDSQLIKRVNLCSETKPWDMIKQKSPMTRSQLKCDRI